MGSHCDLQEIKKQLEDTDDSSCRESLLQFITAFSAHMSPAGLEADMRHILVLVLLLGRLDDPDPTLRLTAAELLISEQNSPKQCFHRSSCDLLKLCTSRAYSSSPVQMLTRLLGDRLQNKSAIACRQSRSVQGLCEGADLWGTKAAGVDWLEYCEEGPSSW